MMALCWRLYFILFGFSFYQAQRRTSPIIKHCHFRSTCRRNFCSTFARAFRPCHTAMRCQLELFTYSSSTFFFQKIYPEACRLFRTAMRSQSCLPVLLLPLSGKKEDILEGFVGPRYEPMLPIFIFSQKDKYISKPNVKAKHVLIVEVRLTLPRTLGPSILVRWVR